MGGRGASSNPYASYAVETIQRMLSDVRQRIESTYKSEEVARIKENSNVFSYKKIIRGLKKAYKQGHKTGVLN